MNDNDLSCIEESIFYPIEKRPCQHNHGVVIDGAIKCFDCGEVIAPSVEVPRRYTLTEIEVLARDFLQTTDSGLGTDGVTMQLKLSIFLRWLAKREKELRG